MLCYNVNGKSRVIIILVKILNTTYAFCLILPIKNNMYDNIALLGLCDNHRS